MTDCEYFNNDANMRPDFNTMRNLIAPENVPMKEKKVFEMMHGDYFGMQFKENDKSLWKKGLNYFYPYYNYNPEPSHFEPFYDYKKDYVPQSMNNHYHFDI